MTKPRMKLILDCGGFFPMKIACAVVIRSRKVLVQNRTRGGARVTEFPMGKVENGETFESAALRELYEETSLQGALSSVPSIQIESSSGGQIGFVFISITPDASPLPDPARKQIYKWCRLSEIPIRDFHQADQEFICSYLAHHIES